MKSFIALIIFCSQLVYAEQNTQNILLDNGQFSGNSGLFSLTINGHQISLAGAGWIPIELKAYKGFGPDIVDANGRPTLQVYDDGGRDPLKTFTGKCDRQDPKDSFCYFEIVEPNRSIEGEALAGEYIHSLEIIDKGTYFEISLNQSFEVSGKNIVTINQWTHSFTKVEMPENP